MNSENVLVFAVGAFLFWLWRNRDETGKVKIPVWLWRCIGIFMIIILIRNASEVIRFVLQQADAWWPLVRGVAQKLGDGLRGFIEKISDH